jgi:plasmid replication initiation protein
MTPTDLTVVKHNALVTGKYSLGIVEQRVMLSIISKINSTEPWDGTDGRYQIDYGEVLDLIDSKHESKRQQMMKATYNLLSRTVKITLSELDDSIFEKFKKIKLDENEAPLDLESDVIQTSWILGPIRYKVGVDVLNIKVDKFLMPFLIEISKNFTGFRLENIMKLPSKYSIRIYELGRRYLSKGQKSYSKEIDYKDFREMIGVDEGSYDRFTDFNKRVLEVSSGEINENTDIKMSFKTIRKRNKVEKIVLKISENESYKKRQIKSQIKQKQEADPVKLELKKRGVTPHKSYEDEGIKDQHWKEALNTDLEGRKLVTEARNVRDKIENDLKKNEMKVSQEELKKNHKCFWNKNYKKYEGLSGYDDSGVIDYKKVDGFIAFMSEDFISKIKPYLKQNVDECEKRSGQERRAKKSLMQGSSDRRRTTRRKG